LKICVPFDGLMGNVNEGLIEDWDNFEAFVLGPFLSFASLASWNSVNREGECRLGYRIKILNG
jgi:hypothetical protein